MKQDVPDNYVRDIKLHLKGFKVIALNVTKLRSDNIDPRNYMHRLARWKERVTSGGGEWRVINDMEHLPDILPQ